MNWKSVEKTALGKSPFQYHEITIFAEALLELKQEIEELKKRMGAGVCLGGLKE